MFSESLQSMHDFQGPLTGPGDTHCQPSKAEKYRFSYSVTLSVTAIINLSTPETAHSQLSSHPQGSEQE